MVDIRTEKYIGFLRFSKIKCGKAFVDAVVNNNVTLELFDAVACYQIGKLGSNFFLSLVEWGWGLTGQRSMGQSFPDWLKMTSSRTS